MTSRISVKLGRAEKLKSMKIKSVYKEWFYWYFEDIVCLSLVGRQFFMDNKTENNCHFLKNTWVELYSRKILQGLLKGQPILGEDEPKFYTHSRTDEKLPAEKPPSAFV